MFYCNRTDVSECILIRSVRVRSVLFVSIGRFFDKEFSFQPTLCNGCHDVLIISVDINNIDILNFYGIDYLCFYLWN